MQQDTTDRFSVASLRRSLRAQFFDLDNGLVGRLRALLVHPGEAIREASANEHHVYAQPLRMFLLANIFFFLIGPSLGLLSFSLDSLGQIPFYAEAASDQAARLGLDVSVYRERFDTTYRFRQPTFLVLLTFPLAAVSFLLYRRIVFGRHYVLALLLLAWLLIVLPILQLGGSLLRRLIPGETPAAWDLVQLGVLALATAWATYRAVWSGLGVPRGRAFLSAAVLCIAILVLLSVYGHLIFWITIGLLEVGK